MNAYKFLNAKYALQAITEQRLKLSRIDDLNDPFELLYPSFADASDRKRLEEFKRVNMSSYGLHCFSKSFSNPLLWSHYADRHRGMALEIEIQNEDCFEINYEPNMLLFDLQQHAKTGGLNETDLAKFLATKFEHWKYEDEVRTFCKLDAATKNDDFYFEPFCDSLKLVRVFMGATCAMTDEEISTALPIGQQLVVVNTMLSFQSYAIEIDQAKSERIVQSKFTKV